MFDVITVGSGTVDVFVETGSKLFRKAKVRKEHGCVLVPFGSKVVIDELRFDIGGGGTNTAVALRRLGLKVAWLGKIGNDDNSKNILKLLKKEKINTKFVYKNEKGSGYSVILDAEGHDRTILTYKGSNNDLSFNEINLRKLKTRWLYFSSMMGESYKTIEKLARYAKEKGIMTAFNPSSYLVKRGKQFLKPILRRVDLLIFNKEEAGLLVGEDTIEMLLRKVHLLGPKVVVITDGNKGAYCYDGKLTYRAPAHKIPVVESTGAGDAFAASFLAGIILKSDIKAALRWGITNSESVITNYGAKNKLMTHSNLMISLRNNPVDVKARL